MLGSAALIVFSVAGLTGVAATRSVFVAATGAGIAGLFGALLALAGMPATGAAAVTLTVAIGVLPGYPSISVWLGRVPVPALPSRAEEILSDRPAPARDDVFAAVARANQLLTGGLFATAVVSVCGAGVLVISGHRTADVLAVIAAVALLLRARLFAAPPQRIPLLASGVTVLASLMVTLTLRASTTHGRLSLLLAELALAGIVLAAGLVYSRRAPSPRVGRLADIIDVLALMALVPLACGAAGAFHAIAGLFASVGG
jgi:type VII secretion integral membrane protein EccD